MISITNNHRSDLEFLTGIRDGVPTFDLVPAGKTKNVAVSADDLTVVVRVSAGMITVAARRNKARAGDPPQS